MGSNIELIDDRFTDGSLVSLHSRFLARTLFTIGTFPGDALLSYVKHPSRQ